jgi:hypothetical protein
MNAVSFFVELHGKRRATVETYLSSTTGRLTATRDWLMRALTILAGFVAITNVRLKIEVEARTVLELQRPLAAD